MVKNCLIIGVFLLIVTSFGCGSARKQTPHMGFSRMSMETKLEREDVLVTKAVEGSSTATTILGFITVVDGDKLMLFGIPFFKDKYTYFDTEGWHLFGPSLIDRAYYKALESAPEADYVFVKSYDHEMEGFPLITGTETVSFRGKAVQIKSDQ